VRKSMIIGCLFLTAVGSGDTRAGESRAEIRADLILEKFDVATGGDLLQIPVRIGEYDHRFVVDTGALDFRTHALSSLRLSLHCSARWSRWSFLPWFSRS
jgi:hypothetical protein